MWPLTDDPPGYSAVLKYDMGQVPSCPLQWKGGKGRKWSRRRIDGLEEREGEEDEKEGAKGEKGEKGATGRQGREGRARRRDGLEEREGR